MIVTERAGDHSIKTYSDEGYYIIQEGTGDKYPEAIDPIDSGRTYVESDELIEVEEEESAVEETIEEPAVWSVWDDDVHYADSNAGHIEPIDEHEEDEPSDPKLSDHGIKIF